MCIIGWTTDIEAIACSHLYDLLQRLDLLGYFLA